MRYIDINPLLTQIPAQVKTALNNKHQGLIKGDDQTREAIIDDGATTWRTVKNILEQASNRKCWYTESKNPGCTNDVDHFRPKAKKLKDDGQIEYWYWFLAFDPENYRLSCQFANRPNVNPIYGVTGGKGDQFPLMPGQTHAINKAGIALENPVILDPCKQGDCDLLSFQPDGRSVLSPNFLTNADALYRVEQSNLILNIDFPTFNEDREAIYNKIKDLVDRGDSYGPGIAQDDVKRDLQDLMQETSAYSKAAECYIRCFRDREWVEQLL